MLWLQYIWICCVYMCIVCTLYILIFNEIRIHAIIIYLSSTSSSPLLLLLLLWINCRCICNVQQFNEMTTKMWIKIKLRRWTCLFSLKLIGNRNILKWIVIGEHLLGQCTMPDMWLSVTAVLLERCNIHYKVHKVTTEGEQKVN